MKIRLGFVSNSSSACYIVSLDAYESVFELAKYMLKIAIEAEKEYLNVEWKENIKKFQLIAKKLEEAKEKGLDPNTNVMLPTWNVETFIVKKEEGYYVDTCHNVDFKSFGTSYEVDSWLLDEDNYFYYADLDVMAKPEYEEVAYCEKCDNHDKIKLENGKLFCPLCEREKFEQYRILKKK